MAGNRGFSSSSPDSLATPSRSQFVHRSTRHLPTPSPGESECDTLEYLNITERWWRAHQPWLEQCGYLLREKYRHDWIPSWKKGGFFSKLHTPEDMIELPVTSRKIDATRISDGSLVHLYLVSEKKFPDAADIMLYLTHRKLTGEYGIENHTTPVLEVLEVDDNPDFCVVVTPLMRGCCDPWFENMGEVVDLLGQVLEGMKFMHAHGVAHRNPQLNGDAIMYDPTDCYPEGFHPVITKMNQCFTGEAFNYSRTERPVRYYFTDFQTAKRYRTGPTSCHRSKRRLRWADEIEMDYPLLWKNNFAPEFKMPEKKCDPFKVDVFLLGAEISRQFVEKYRGFGWLRPLIDDMCREDPNLRITAAEAYVRFLWLSASIDSSKLDEKLTSKRKRGATRRIIRKCEKKLRIRALLREMGLRDEGGSTVGPSPAMGFSWLPVL